jgi:hypothetical protein
VVEANDGQRVAGGATTMSAGSPDPSTWLDLANIVVEADAVLGGAYDREVQDIRAAKGPPPMRKKLPGMPAGAGGGSGQGRRPVDPAETASGRAGRRDQRRAITDTVVVVACERAVPLSDEHPLCRTTQPETVALQNPCHYPPAFSLP